MVQIMTWLAQCFQPMYSIPAAAPATPMITGGTTKSKEKMPAIKEAILAVFTSLQANTRWNNAC